MIDTRPVVTPPPRRGMPPDEPNTDALRELANQPRWLCWKLEYIDGRWTKPPYQTNGRKASSTGPTTWTTYTRAIAAAKSGRFDGIGYVLFRGHPDVDPIAWPADTLVGVDFDDCIDPRTGEIELTAERQMRSLNSYSEVSPSGEGMRVFVRATLPPGHNRKGPVEMYETGRYLTVTAQHIAGTPTTIEPRQAEIEHLFAEVFPAATAPSNQRVSPHPDPRQIDRGDDELLARISASKQGPKFDALFFRGDVQTYHGGDDSSADCGLASILCWWADKDESRVLRLMQTSKLNRDKWNRSDYLPRTIAAAASLIISTYRDGGEPPGDLAEPRRDQQAAALKRAFGLSSGPVVALQPWQVKAELLRRARQEPTQNDEWDWRADLAAADPVARTPGAHYLETRAIPLEIAAAAGVLYVRSWAGHPAVVFPFRDRAGALVAAQGRHLTNDLKPNKRTGGPSKMGVFATPGAFNAATVAIVEAPIDALSLAAAGLPAIALHGTNAPAWLAAALAFKTVCVALDNDKAGNDASLRLIGELSAFGGRCERLHPAAGKDWNEILVAKGLAALVEELSRNGLCAAETETSSARAKVANDRPVDWESILQSIGEPNPISDLRYELIWRAVDHAWPSFTAADGSVLSDESSWISWTSDVRRTEGELTRSLKALRAG